MFTVRINSPRLRAIVLLGIVAPLSVCARPRAPFAAVRSEHLMHLRQFGADRVAAWVQESPETFLRYYASDIRLMTEQQFTVLGRDHATAYHRAFLRRFAVKAYERRPLEALSLGGKIVEWGTFTLRMALKRSGAEHDITGKFLEIWSESREGLKLVTEAWNYDRHLPSEWEMRFLEVPGVRMALEAHVPVRAGIAFELAALNKLHESAVAEHDGRVWAMFYADDAVLLHNNHKLLRGRAEIEEFMTQHAADRPVFEKLDIRCDRFDELNGFVVEYASHVANWRNGDSSGVNTGKNIRIWRREADCSLKIVWAIGMYD